MQKILNKKFITIILTLVFACNLFFIPISNNSLSSYSFGPHHAYAANGTLAGDLTPGESGESWIFDIWNFSLSLVNMVLIGILLFLAAVNILNLNVDTYALKKFLLPLIVSVILANFSMFICRAIVEFATALTGTFLKDYNEIVDGILTGLSFGSKQTLIQWSAQLASTSGSSSLSNTIGIGEMLIYLFLGIIGSLIVCIVVLLLSLLLYVRWFVVLILASVAPIAFIFMVLPLTQNLFRQWWSWFLRWVFIGPLVSFVLYVAAVVGKSSQSGTGTHSWVSVLVLFIITIGLLILALFIPFMLGGQVFNKITSTAKGVGGFAGKYVPGIRHANSFVGGVIKKNQANLEASNRSMEELGYGLAEDGFSGMKRNAEIAQRGRAQEEAKKLVNIDQPMSSAALSKMQQKNPYFIEEYMKTMAKNKKLDNTELNKIIDLHLQGKIKSPSIKNTNDLEQAINRSLDIQKDSYARDHQSAPNINNPLSQFALDSKGNIQKDSTGNPIKLTADDLAVKNANNNVDDYQKISSRSSSPRERQGSAQKVIDALKLLDNELAKGSAASKQYNANKHKEAIANFQALEQAAENDPTLNAVANSKTFQELSLKHGISNKISSVVNDIVPGTTGSLGSERKQHLREMLGKKINVYDTSGAPQEHQIRKILIAKDAMHSKMSKLSLNINNDSDVEKYIKSQGGSDDVYNNFINNNNSVKQNSILAQQIAGQLRSSGNITAPDTHLF